MNVLKYIYIWHITHTHRIFVFRMVLFQEDRDGHLGPVATGLRLVSGGPGDLHRLVDHGSAHHVPRLRKTKGKTTGIRRETGENQGKPGKNQDIFWFLPGTEWKKGPLKWREGAFQANPGVFVKRNDVSPAWTHVFWEENTVVFADFTGKHHLWREIAWNSCKKWEFHHADFKEKITRRQRFLGGYIIWLVVWNVNSISN